MKTILILKFLGWSTITIVLMCSIVGFIFLIPELDKEETSWFYKPLKILDEIGV